jgi:hypothetical protein
MASKIFDNYLDFYEVAGKIVGKALYEGVLLHPVFSRAFLNKLLTKPC